MGFSVDLFIFEANSFWTDSTGALKSGSETGFFPCWTGPLTSSQALNTAVCESDYLSILHHPVLGTIAATAVIFAIIIGFAIAHYKCSKSCQALPLKLSSKSRGALVFVCFIGFLVAFIPLLTVFLGTEIPYGPCETFKDKDACQQHYSVGAAFTNCHTCSWVVQPDSGKGACHRAMRALGPKADTFYTTYFPNVTTDIFPSCASWPSLILPSVALAFPTLVLVVFGFLTYRAPSVDEGYAPVETGVELSLNY